MRIREANKEDVPFIINLLRQNNLPCEDVSSKVDCFFVGYVEEEPIGIGGLEIYGNYGLLRSLVEEIYLLTETAKDFFNKIGFKYLCPSTAICMRMKI